MTFYTKLTFILFVIILSRSNAMNRKKMLFKDGKLAGLIANASTFSAPVQLILNSNFDDSVYVGVNNQILMLSKNLVLKRSQQIFTTTGVSYFANALLCVKDVQFVLCDRLYSKSCSLYRRNNYDILLEKRYAFKKNYQMSIFIVQAKMEFGKTKCKMKVSLAEFVEYNQYILDHCEKATHSNINITGKGYNEIAFFHDTFVKNISGNELLQFEFDGATYYLWTANEETHLTRLEYDGINKLDKKMCCTEGTINYTLAIAAAVKRGNGKEDGKTVVAVFKKLSSESGSVVCTFLLESSMTGYKVKKSSFSNCSLFSNCSTCVQEGYAFGCGWCGQLCMTKHNCKEKFFYTVCTKETKTDERRERNDLVKRLSFSLLGLVILLILVCCTSKKIIQSRKSGRKTVPRETEDSILYQEVSNRNQEGDQPSRDIPMIERAARRRVYDAEDSNEELHNFHLEANV